MKFEVPKFIRKLAPLHIIRHLLWRTGLDQVLNNIFWHKVSSGDEFETLYHIERKQLDGAPSEFLNPKFSEFNRQDREIRSRQCEFIIKVENAVLEPRESLGILSGRRVISQTTMRYTQYPRILPYIWIKKRPIFIEKGILYDGIASKNLFHHFKDALNAVHILEKSDISKDVPMIINESAFKSKYFQYILKNSGHLQNYNWIVQRAGEWLRVKHLYLLQATDFDPKIWKKSISLYKTDVTCSGRRIFLSRDRHLYNRCLTNEIEVFEILQKYGFEKVYAEHLMIEEQIETFGQASHVVAIHGAGLTNEIFMNPESAHVIEIMPENYFDSHYYWLAFTLGFRYYDVIIGNAFDSRKNFKLDLNLLECAVNRMLQTNLKKHTYGCVVD